MSKRTKIASQKSPKLTKKIIEKIKASAPFKIAEKKVAKSEDENLPEWTKKIKNYKKFKDLTAEESFTLMIMDMYPHLMGSQLFTAISSYYSQLPTDDAPDFSVEKFNIHLEMLSHYGYINPFYVDTLRTGVYTLH